nr:hypothetical protein [Tanacetum cinerariifolium]
MQTQTSNTLHNAIMEAGGKDRPPMLAPGNYVQWKSRIKRYIDTKPNYELIHYCLKNPPYKFTWADKEVPISEGIDNDIYSIVDACPNACEIKFTSRDGESPKSYYSRFYKMMNELVRNQYDVTNHQVNVQFLLQLQPEWQRFVTLVKQSQELKTVSYHKLYDILKQHQNEVNEIKAERIARAANPLALVAQQPPVYHPQNQPSMAAEDDEMSKDKEIDKPMALISLSFKKIYKPTNNNLRTSSNTNRANQDNFQGLTEALGIKIKGLNPKRAKDAAYHKEKMLLCKQKDVGIQLNAEQADWRDDTDNESKDQELEAHYIYMEQIQEVSLDAAASPIFDAEPLQKNDDDNDLANERELLASLIKKIKCEIDDSKNRNKFLETSNKVLVDKLKGDIEDFKNKNKNKSLESSNNRFKEANNKLSKTNALMYNDLKKFKAELDRHNDV